MLGMLGSCLCVHAQYSVHLWALYGPNSMSMKAVMLWHSKESDGLLVGTFTFPAADSAWVA